MKQLIFVDFKYYNNDTILLFIKELFSMIDYDFEDFIVKEERAFLPDTHYDRSDQQHHPIRSQSLEIMVLTIDDEYIPEALLHLIENIPSLRKELNKGFTTYDFYSIKGVTKNTPIPYKTIEQLIADKEIPYIKQDE